MGTAKRFSHENFQLYDIEFWFDTAKKKKKKEKTHTYVWNIITCKFLTVLLKKNLKTTKKN